MLTLTFIVARVRRASRFWQIRKIRQQSKIMLARTLLHTCIRTLARVQRTTTFVCRFARLPADEVDEELVEVDTVETIERP